MADTLFDELGGMPCLERVHRIFYDKLRGHAWLKGVLAGVRSQHLESQQSEFMSRLFGGPVIYAGRMPRDAHVHMFITEEIFLLRHEILDQSLIAAGIRSDLQKPRLHYDMGRLAPGTGKEGTGQIYMAEVPLDDIA